MILVTLWLIFFIYYGFYNYVDEINEIAVCYFQGFGVGKNEEVAVKYFKLAADQGDLKAQCNLGDNDILKPPV